MRNIATISWLTFEEARRRFVALAALVLGAGFILLYTIGLNFIASNMQAHQLSDVQLEFNYNVLLLAGLYVVHFLTIMLTIFASVDTVAGEISSHTIQAILTKPVERWQVLAGKWLGLAIMLVLYMFLLSIGLVLATFFTVGFLPPNLAEGIATIVLEVLVLLSLSLLGGTRLSTMTNGVVLFMFYGLAFIGTWVEQIGAAIQVEGAVRVGIITSLFLPVEALWRRAAYLMQPSLLQNFPATPFTASSTPSSAMVLYAVGYALVIFGLATQLFKRSDL